MVESRDFNTDLNNSNNLLLRKSWGKVFILKFGEDCKILWKDELNEQKGFGTDVTIQTSKGRRYSVELKTRNKNCYKDTRWIMEIVSHRYDRESEPRTFLHSKEGWIYSTTAEYIFHGTLNEDGTDLTEVIFYILIPFKTLKWKSEFDKYDNLWLATLFSETGIFQLTLNKLIPLDVIKNNTIEFWEWSR